MGDNRNSTTSQFPAPLHRFESVSWALSLLACMGMSVAVFLGAMWTARWMSKEGGGGAEIGGGMSCEAPMKVDWCVRRGDEAVCFSRLADVP